MNEVTVSHPFVVWLLWSVAVSAVISIKAVRSYLVRLRYRELREDIEVEKERLGPLFKLIENTRKYQQYMGSKPVALWFAIIGATWVWLSMGYVQQFTQIPLSWMERIWVVVFWMLSAALHLLLCIWLPTTLGHRLNRIQILLSTYYVLCVGLLLRPFVFFSELGVRLLKVAGINRIAEPEPMDRDLQIMAIGREFGKITKITEKIASKAFDLSSVTVYDILLPRNEVQIFDLNDSNEINIDRARKTGHTRFPLCRDDLDHCEGIIHIKDIFRLRQSIDSVDFEKIARPILRISEEKPIDKALQILLTQRAHMALVEDDFGGILGVLTLERILEELVGEIQDEFDKEEKMIVSLKKDFYKIYGLTPVHEVEDQLGVEGLEHEDVSSFGGLITNHLGRIPEKGEKVELGPFLITILETEETRVISTTVKVLPFSGDEETAGS